MSSKSRVSVKHGLATVVQGDWESPSRKPQWQRRHVLKWGAAALTASTFSTAAWPPAPRPKKVVVAGAGIGGLCCAYELMKRGHDVTVLEASGRTGGHVLTIRDRLADGFYVDAGAENFTKPGYDICWRYIKDFGLSTLRLGKHDSVSRRIGNQMYTDEMLRDPAVLRKLGFNPREIRYLARVKRWSPARLYFASYLDSFEDPYKPFNAQLSHLDHVTVRELLEKDGASAKAVEIAGSNRSALSVVWHEAVLKSRGAYEREVYRIVGGNQLLTDALTSRLGDRVWLGCPVTEIHRWDDGVRVRYKQFGREEKQIDADFLVSCISLPLLAEIPVTPAWPAEKVYVITKVPYYSHSRVIFQSRSRFWEQDKLSPNLVFADTSLSHTWRMGEDIRSSRGLLVGTAPATGSAEAALSTFRSYYAGQTENIEQVKVVAWPSSRWSAFCERVHYLPGELPKFWPTIIEPAGRVLFAGAYADNIRWGMDAATRSAHRAADVIDEA